MSQKTSLFDNASATPKIGADATVADSLIPDFNGGNSQSSRVFKIVLTGGPCGGKTTGQAYLTNFFENIGWRVFRCPEIATILLGGGINFSELCEQAVHNFQTNLLRTMFCMEQTYCDLAYSLIREREYKKYLIIFDRGSMDPSAYASKESWLETTKELGCTDVVALRDTRYDAVFHLVTAADGAEAFYSGENNSTRKESLEQAINQDKKTQAAWLGHPCFHIIDNVSTNFESKMSRLVCLVADYLGISVTQSFRSETTKKKFLIKEWTADFSFTVPFEDSEVEHQYLTLSQASLCSESDGSTTLNTIGDAENASAVSNFDPSSSPLQPQAAYTCQARIRKRGKGGVFTYTHTLRRPKIKGQSVECKMQITKRQYLNFSRQKDKKHVTIHKLRRSFIWENHYFQLDKYIEPFPTRCKGLILLEVYTTKNSSDISFPPFLKVEREVTGLPQYSMWNLSFKNGLFMKLDCLMKNGEFQSPNSFLSK